MFKELSQELEHLQSLYNKMETEKDKYQDEMIEHKKKVDALNDQVMSQQINKDIVHQSLIHLKNALKIQKEIKEDFENDERRVALEEKRLDKIVQTLDGLEEDYKGALRKYSDTARIFFMRLYGSKFLDKFINLKKDLQEQLRMGKIGDIVAESQNRKYKELESKMKGDVLRHVETQLMKLVSAYSEQDIFNCEDNPAMCERALANLNQKIKILHKQYKLLETSKLVSKAPQARMDKIFNDLRFENQALRSKMDSYKVQVEDAQKEIQILRQSRKDLTEEEKKSRKEFTEKKKHVDTLIHEISELKDLMQQKDQYIDSLEMSAKNQNFNAQLQTYEKALIDTRKERNDLKGRLDISISTMKELQREIEIAKNDQENLMAERQSVEEREKIIRDKTRYLAKLEKDRSKLDKQLRDRENETEKLRNRIDRILEESDILEERIKNYKLKLEASVPEEELHVLQAKLNKCMKEQKDVEDEKHRVKNMMENLQEQNQVLNRKYEKIIAANQMVREDLQKRLEDIRKESVDFNKFSVSEMKRIFQKMKIDPNLTEKSRQEYISQWNQLLHQVENQNFEQNQRINQIHRQSIERVPQLFKEIAQDDSPEAFEELSKIGNEEYIKYMNDKSERLQHILNMVDKTMERKHGNITHTAGTAPRSILRKNPIKTRLFQNRPHIKRRLLDKLTDEEIKVRNRLRSYSENKNHPFVVDQAMKDLEKNAVKRRSVLESEKHTLNSQVRAQDHFLKEVEQFRDDIEARLKEIGPQPDHSGLRRRLQQYKSDIDRQAIEERHKAEYNKLGVSKVNDEIDMIIQGMKVMKETQENLMYNDGKPSKLIITPFESLYDLNEEQKTLKSRSGMSAKVSKNQLNSSLAGVGLIRIPDDSLLKVDDAFTNPQDSNAIKSSIFNLTKGYTDSIIITVNPYFDAKNIKKNYKETLDSIWAEVLYQSQENLDFSLIQINAQQERYDMIGSKMLPKNCNIFTCAAQRERISTKGMSVKDVIFQVNRRLQNMPFAQDRNIITSFYFANGRRIHVIDIFYSEAFTNKPQRTQKQYMDNITQKSNELNQLRQLMSQADDAEEKEQIRVQIRELKQQDWNPVDPVNFEYKAKIFNKFIYDNFQDSWTSFFEPITSGNDWTFRLILGDTSNSSMVVTSNAIHDFWLSLQQR